MKNESDWPFFVLSYNKRHPYDYAHFSIYLRTCINCQGIFSEVKILVREFKFLGPPSVHKYLVEDTIEKGLKDI